MRSLMMALAALAAISFASAPAMAANSDAHKATGIHHAKAEKKHEKREHHKVHHKAHKKEHKMEKKKEGEKR